MLNDQKIVDNLYQHYLKFYVYENDTNKKFEAACYLLEEIGNLVPTGSQGSDDKLEEIRSIIRNEFLNILK